MKIIYTQNAIKDLERVHQFIANDNPPIAFEVAEKIIQAVMRLVEFPHLGRRVKSSKSKTTIRDLITGKYVIRYLILKNEIHILRVWHGRENWNKK